MIDTVPVPSPRGYAKATLHLTIDPTEHARRQDRSIGSLTHWSIIETCLHLPHAEPIPWQALTIRQQNVVRQAPPGVFRITGHRHHPKVTRIALRPCRVVRATVRSATACATALGNVTSYAPFCERSLIVTRLPRMPETLIEFGFWGVGLYLDHDGELETLVEPTTWRPMRITAAGWRFAEEAYGSYLKHAAHVPERTRP
ncbi:hypothetical protein DMH12_24875 [Streptomyces sp. WAC 04229]|uniref:hypothetical protein n=1 Tax=Streptomyces sp. WAC 04229 TaxID=2203206 RepID=UPI000F73E759|nr:hypothetical protein [Streptomyces sp. WAC 04229]RSN50519.1 hypothetical protein DMH12_24875 [Streptomyces sp. WAC 04229]